jgi:hypothetical protein
VTYPYLSGTFDDWTGYVLFAKLYTPDHNGLVAFDPGTGHVPGSLEKYPIPKLNKYVIYSLTVEPSTGDFYFIASVNSDPPIHFYRVTRATGDITQLAETAAVSIAFGEPIRLRP